MASVLDLVKHYQRSIEKYPNDEQKILKCIDKLYNLGVTVQHLQDTGVGRTVNALRKEAGEVGQAARALVLKWKVMVAAEESDQEGDHNDDTTNYSSHDNGRDYESNSSKSRSKHEGSEKSDRTPKTEEKNHKHTNGNYSGSKRKYQSSEEEEHDTTKSKYSRDNGYTSGSKTRIESDKARSDSEDSQDESSQSDSNSEDSQSEEEKVPEVKPKIEKKHYQIEPHKSSSHIKHSSSSRDKHQQESSHPKQDTEKHDGHNNSSSDKRHSSDKSKEKSHRSNSQRNSREHERSTEKKDKEHRHSGKEQINKEEPLSRHSDKHRSNNSSDKCRTSTSSEKHKSSSSSDRHKSNSNAEKHKPSSEQKHRSSGSSEKNKINSSEHHGSHSEKNLPNNQEKQSSHKSDKERHKRSYENEISSDKPKSIERRSSKDEQRKEKTKEKHQSSKDKDSHKVEKKHSSKNSESSNSKRKPDSSRRAADCAHTDTRTAHTDTHTDTRATHTDTRTTHTTTRKTSSSKHKSKATDEKEKAPKKGEDSDDGIDCGSGASFAEALGMSVSPTKPKKKSGLFKENIQSPNSPNFDLSPGQFLAPLPSLEVLALPEISPHYRPRAPPKLLPHFSDEDAMCSAISSKNQRTKVYSGNKVIGKITSLYEMCVQVLQEHIEALEYTGGVPYEILKPVVDRATPRQLFALEHYNPYLMDDTDHLWQKFCEKSFRNKKRQEMETWREMYIRCQEEQEIKLKSLTANIRLTQEAKKAPIKQTKMAYVDSVVKPPRSVAKKQAQHGTAFAAAASPAARVASLSATSNVLKGGRAAPAPVLTSNFKPKKAPLMQKALQFMRGRKR